MKWHEKGLDLQYTMQCKAAILYCHSWGHITIRMWELKQDQIITEIPEWHTFTRVLWIVWNIRCQDQVPNSIWRLICLRPENRMQKNGITGQYLHCHKLIANTTRSSCGNQHMKELVVGNHWQRRLEWLPDSLSTGELVLVFPNSIVRTENARVKTRCLNCLWWWGVSETLSWWEVVLS